MKNIAQHNAQVCIVTRTKDRPLFLSRAIESILAQTYTSWQHVIVNDGGNRTEIEDIISRFKEQYNGRLLLIHNPSQQGRWMSAKHGVESNQTPYISFLDDDDTWSAEYLERMIAALQHETFKDAQKGQGVPTKGVFCYARIIKEKVKNGVISEVSRHNFNQHLLSINLLELIAWNRFMPGCFVFERSAYDELGGFDTDLPLGGDWEFNIRFLVKYNIYLLREDLYFWHHRPSSTGVEGNSVISERDNHFLVRNILINRWVRESISKNTMNYGELFGHAMAWEVHSLMSKRLDRLEESMPKKLHRFFKKITKKLKYNAHS